MGSLESFRVQEEAMQVFQHERLWDRGHGVFISSFRKLSPTD